jgi:hypothetical protein
VLGGASTARADGEVEVQFLIKPADPTNPKTKGDAPQIEATIIGAPNLTPDKFILVDKSAKPPVEIKAVSKRNFNQGTETLAVAIVMLGWEMWIGNTTFRPEGDLTREKGVLVDLQAALDKLNFKEAGPPGSVGMVITYADTAVIRVPMGPLGNLSGSALGTQKDYKDTKGYELVKGIELALAELRKVQNPRKVLIVVCDGNDTNNDAAKGQLQVLKTQARNDRVQTFAIVYKAADSEPNNVILSMIQQTSTVTTPENIATAIQSILARMADRQYLTFPGYNKETKIGLKWDGKPHDLAVKIDKEETEPQQVTLAPTWNLDEGGFPWLVLILALVGFLLLVIIGVKVFSRKSAPAPVPVPMAVAPMPEAPKPMGPAKTVMIGRGGDEGGFPIVGWIVPLNGQHAYQTFRLRSGGTKIGTAPHNDVAINDGFMSSDQCRIDCTPMGFALVDPGSTNGCYVNDKRVMKQDLVDNDVITLGKTNFRFKSIV